MINIFRLKATEKAISLTNSDFLQFPALICADEKRLRQVLLNILSNAIKFTNQGGVNFTVKVIELVELEQVDKNLKLHHNLSTSARIRFRVEDTGIGLTKQQLSKIFFCLLSKWESKDIALKAQVYG